MSLATWISQSAMSVIVSGSPTDGVSWFMSASFMMPRVSSDPPSIHLVICCLSFGIQGGLDVLMLMLALA